MSAFRRFMSIRRSFLSFVVLSALFLLSLGAEFIAGNRPLLLSFNRELYFPIFTFYAGERFGQPQKTEADYKVLRDDPAFQERGWMVFPLISYSPLEPDIEEPGAPPHPPSWRHPLGTDGSGRDVLARLLYGFRICMLFSILLTAVTGVTGITLGAIQGYTGGKIDLLIQRFTEIWSALPFLYVVILLGSIFGQSFFMLLIVLSLFSWIGLSLYMRAEFLKIRNMTYVKAARAIGVGKATVLFRHILPNALTPAITILPFTLISGIGSLTSLDFLGFGMPPPTPSWGELLDQGLKNLQAPWIAVSTVLALFFTLLMATFISEGIREAVDPKAVKSGR
jgi:microcin C transport system permease protein